MIKKIGNKGLLLILLMLLALFGLFRYISSKHSENTFQTALIPHIDTTRLTGMVIFAKKLDASPKGVRGHSLPPFVFDKRGKDWYVSQEGVTSRAAEHSAKYLISLIAAISPDRLGSNDPKDWKQFNVTDSLGTRVVFLYGKDTVADVIVGRFSYIPQEKKGISYLRLSGQKEVYAVEGFLSMNITEDFDAWRDKKIMPEEPGNWNKLTFIYPSDSGYVLLKDSNDSWKFGDGKKPDSLTTVKAVEEIANQNYGTFINKFDTNGKPVVFRLKIEGSGFNAVVLKAYVADTANKFAITSSINPGSYFSGKADFLNRIFRSRSSFYKKEEKKRK
jgi:Domain of unknown function (DUF4340)